MSASVPTYAIDTAPWIYWIEEHRAFLPSLEPIFRQISEGRAIAVASVLVLLEVTTGALRKRDDVLAARYREIFEGMQGVALMDVNASLSIEAARLRARHGLRTADAVHVATALASGATAFVTTDRRLARVDELEVRVLRPTPKRRSS